MSQWTCKSVHCFPRSVGIILIFGLCVVFTTAVLRKDVTPYVPFISEAGAYPPESGIFSLFLDITACIGAITIILRYMIVEECNQAISKAMTILNRISLVIGFISMLGMLIVSSYPMITIIEAHTLGALTLFVGSILYGACQAWISYKMFPHYNGIFICRLRVVLVCLSTLTFIMMTITGTKARGNRGLGHWSGKKMPGDEGFAYLVSSATAEWVMCFLFIGYFFTYIREFSKISVNLNVDMLVSHFDDEVPSHRRQESTTLL